MQVVNLQQLQGATRMNTRTLFAIGLTLCLAAGAGFALDQGKIELSAGYEMKTTYGYYDKDGYHAASGDLPVIHKIPLKFRYGILEGLQAGVDVPIVFQNKAAGDKAGLDRPALYGEYVHPQLNLGAFAKMLLPVGNEGIASSTSFKVDPEIDLGLIYAPSFGDFSLWATLEYDLTFEGDDKFKQDMVVLYLEPAYIGVKNLYAYLGLELDYSFDVSFSGTKLDKSSNWVVLVGPGAAYDINPMINVGLNVPFTVLGGAPDYYPSFASWKLAATVKVKL
jgi:hypothetical protein